MWAVFNGSMKEEGRFPYDQRESAEERVQQLKLKSPKKIYFIQTIKEVVAPPAKSALEEASAKTPAIGPLRKQKPPAVWPGVLFLSR